MDKKHLFDEILAISIFAAVILALASLISYDSSDIPFLTSHPNIPAKNIIRSAGAYFAWAAFFLIGWASYILPLFLCLLGVDKIRRRGPRAGRPAVVLSRAGAAGLLVFSLASLSSLCFFSSARESFRAGGIVGLYISRFITDYFGRVGAYVILSTFCLLCLLLLGEFLLFPLLARFCSRLGSLCRRVKSWLWSKRGLVFGGGGSAQRVRIKIRKPADMSPVKDALRRPAGREAGEQKRDKDRRAGHILKAPLGDKREIDKPDKAISRGLAPVGDNGEYRLPGPELLEDPPRPCGRIKEDLNVGARILEETLSDFGLSARVTDIEQGPAITRYELDPAPGVKVQKVVSLSDDIALAMKAQSVRVVAPIPGKGRIGIEIPNTQAGSVYFKELVCAPEFGGGHNLAMAIGKDTAGRPITADLGDMPHLLIAGTTGSGKTVCVNCLIMSLLFRLTPWELKFLMVDPKMVELAVFNKLPHLLSPVVTEAKKASLALNWVVGEMERRYKVLAAEGARNIEGYNNKRPADKLPYIVVVVDELADLMAVAQNQIETAITRLAQLSRAVGIHLILATQRPSVDVITGVIKANFPARISFQVASKVDSRTVLDVNGADKLLGKGDMLFLQPGRSKPARLQGGYLQDKEIERVVEFAAAQAQSVYNEEVLSQQEKAGYAPEGRQDELFDDAARVILESNQASVSILQRRMRLGYTRAARLIDAMEEAGIVGPYEGSRPRKILVDKEAYLSR